jgi:hypothetical protein
MAEARGSRSRQPEPEPRRMTRDGSDTPSDADGLGFYARVVSA